MQPAFRVLGACIAGVLLVAFPCRPLAAEVTPAEGLWPAAGIAASPQAAYNFLGNDFLGRHLGIGEASGLRLGGYVATELNWIASGGVKPGSSVGSVALGLHALVDTQKTLNLAGGTFGIELLLSAAGRSNDYAGSVQMYTNMDSPEPRNRQDLQQIWWRQRLLDDKLLVQVGKMNPAGSFGTVLNPVAVSDPHLQDSNISNLTFTPVGLNPTLYGWSPAYPNTAYGAVVHLVPTNDLYVSLGIFDGNGAHGVQTGCEWLPTINGYTFSIAEVGYSWRLGQSGMPGRIGLGNWWQTGDLWAPGPVLVNGAKGFYLFANQRLWYATPNVDNSGLIGYLQYGRTGSPASTVNRYVGAGLTGIGMIPGRPFDTVSFGLARSVLNDAPGAGSFFYPDVPSDSTDLNPSETMLQATYAANFALGTPANYWTFTAIAAYTYIPNPGQRPDLPAAHVLSLRLVALF